MNLFSILWARFYFLRKSSSLILILALFPYGAFHAQEQIGAAWEFNEDANLEGWSVLLGASSFQVSDSVLTLVPSGWFPSIKSPDFDIPAADYGIIVVRMRMKYATSARFMWENDSGQYGVRSFPFVSDTLYHEYCVPVYDHQNWSGHIRRFGKFEISGNAKIVGTEIDIDYIRILSYGFKPSVGFFKFLRTVLKPLDNIPLRAGIKNSGDRTGSVRVCLFLPEECRLVEGMDQTEILNLERGKTDTLKWTVTCQDTGHFTWKLSVMTLPSDSAGTADSTGSVLDAVFTTQYWRQEDIFMSAWSPPYAWYPPPYLDEVMEAYRLANFNIVLWIRPEDDLAQLVEKYNMKYLLLVTHLVGGDLCLRAPDETVPPDITQEMLSNLDPVIEKYKNNPDVLGYFIIDEPHKEAFPNIGRVVSYLRQKDPGRLSFVNIWPGTNNEEYNSYIEGLLDQTRVELLSYDRYVFFNGYDGGEFFPNISVIRKHAMRYDIPFCNIIQAIGTNGTSESQLDWRTPSEAVHRWQVYASLAYGAKGIIWFHWHLDWGVTGSSDYDQVYASIQKTNAEINTLGPIMAGLRSTAVYHTGRVPGGELSLPYGTIVQSVSPDADRIIGFFKDSTGKDYVMLMNRNYNSSVTAAVTLSGVTEEILLFNVRTGEWEAAACDSASGRTSFTAEISAGGGKLFMIGTLTGVSSTAEAGFPDRFTLQQNYPNPFNPSTIIPFKIARSSQVTLSIFDLKARKIRTLVHSHKEAGLYRVTWDGKDDGGRKAPSGLYFYRIETGSGDDIVAEMKKMIMIK